ncbi:hypothetical protein ACHAPJ_009005 [Fusarium lateritium]
METLAALLVAGAVIQFIDFGSKLLSSSRQLYRSTDGVTTETLDMKLVTTDLSTLLQGLKQKLPQYRPMTKEKNTSEDDAATDDLCKRCVEIAEELLLRVNKLKLEPRDQASSGSPKDDVKGPKPLVQKQNKALVSMEKGSRPALKQQWIGLIKAAEAGCEGSFKKWNSFRKALEAPWSKSEIEALASTMREI